MAQRKHYLLLGDEPDVDGDDPLGYHQIAARLTELIHQSRPVTPQRGRRSQALEQVQPREVVAGAPVTIRLSADEIREVVKELREKAKEQSLRPITSVLSRVTTRKQSLSNSRSQ